MPVVRHSLLLLLAGMLPAMSLTGCASYRFGIDSLYRPDIRTIHVAMATSDSLRRGLGERLTEAIVKEIESHTPYKVVDSVAADSVLQARIISDKKRVVSENINDEPREVDFKIEVQVTWVDRRGNLLLPATAIPITPLLIESNQSSAFVPEAGQSVSTAQLAALEKLAEQIVLQLQTRW